MDETECSDDRKYAPCKALGKKPKIHSGAMPKSTPSELTGAVFCAIQARQGTQGKGLPAQLMNRFFVVNIWTSAGTACQSTPTTLPTHPLHRTARLTLPPLRFCCGVLSFDFT